MVAFLTFIHILNCVGLMIVVLLQAGTGAGMAGVFGASSAGSQIFGGRGASSFLGKATAVMAVLFMLTSIALTLAGNAAPTKHSIVRDAAEHSAQEAPTPTGSPGAPIGGLPGAGGGGGSASPLGAGGSAAPGGSAPSAPPQAPPSGGK